MTKLFKLLIVLLAGVFFAVGAVLLPSTITEPSRMLLFGGSLIGIASFGRKIIVSYI